MTSLEVKLRTAAEAWPALTALLGTSPFRWFDVQLDQKQGKTLPAVVVLGVSNPRTYAFNARMVTNYSRMQFTIWGNTGEEARAVESELANFLDGFNAIGIAGLSQYPNIIVGSRGGMFPQTQAGRYLRIVDAMIFNNELVN